ncbi:hypothetical protein TNCV_408421 [Trichonephila clavipes]|nr:hypothetical protein TNCV_408421 [Trichonephila clavipes]
MPGKRSPDNNAPTWTVPTIVAGCLLSEISRNVRQLPSIRWSMKRDSSENATCRYSVDVHLRYWRANSSRYRRTENSIEPKRPLTSDIPQLRINKINENEGGLRIEEFRVSNSTVEIEPASSHKLGVELPKSEDL